MHHAWMFHPKKSWKWQYAHCIQLVCQGLSSGLAVQVGNSGSSGFLSCSLAVSSRWSASQGGGYSMDLNFALLVLPTLKSLQTTMRCGKRGAELLLGKMTFPQMTRNHKSWRTELLGSLSPLQASEFVQGVGAHWRTLGIRASWRSMDPFCSWISDSLLSTFYTFLYHPFLPICDWCLCPWKASAKQSY